VLGAASVKPALFTRVGRILYEGYLRRGQIDTAIQTHGLPLK